MPMGARSGIETPSLPTSGAARAEGEQGVPPSFRVPLVPVPHTQALGPPRPPDAFSEKSTVPIDVWFATLEFYLDEVSVAPQNRVRASLKYFDSNSFYRIRSARLDETADWDEFKSRVRGLFGRSVSSGALQERLFTVVTELGRERVALCRPGVRECHEDISAVHLR